MPRKFSNSKGINFFTEISKNKRIQKLEKETRIANKNIREDKKQKKNTK